MMHSIDLRFFARATFVVVLAGAVGCTFNDQALNLGQDDAGDEDSDAGEPLGGQGGGGGPIGGMDGGQGDRFATVDGPGGSKDGPLGPDLGADAPAPANDAPRSTDAPGQPIGAACGSDASCASGFCVDKVCCEKRCGEACFSCTGANTGAAPGLCRPVAANSSCGSALCTGATLTPGPRCDGNGTCVPGTAAACANSLVCASASACKTRCDADADCTGGLACDVATGACRHPAKRNGQACAAAAECASGHCTDKVCCDLNCNGICRACVMALTGQPDGVCADVVPGTKETRCPKDGCHDGTCAAGAACRALPDGTTCSTECCRGGGGGRICSFQCLNGTCNMRDPTVLERCEGGPVGASCCCPGAGAAGAPMCTTLLNCPLGCVR